MSDSELVQGAVAMKYASAIVAAIVLLSWSGVAQAQCRSDDAIEWSVEGRFRLTAYDAEGRRRTDELLKGLAAAGPDSASMFRSYDQVIEALVARPGASGLYEHTFYDRRRETYRHTDSEGRSFLSPDSQDISIRIPGGRGQCRWSADGLSGAFDCAAGASVRLSQAEAPSVLRVQLPNGRSVQACIQVRDTLVVAFGDSFAAGEGNPDRPANWAGLAGRPLPDGHRQIDWWSQDLDLPTDASADWWDNTCHRSLLSQHAQAALAMAARNPHGTVTFVSFACSGATVLDGFVAPRSSSPGGYRAVGRERGSTAHRVSQLNQAVNFLCAEFDDDMRWILMPIPHRARHWNRLLRGARQEAGQARDQIAIRHCRRWRRQPDIVLNSLGGNDIGFAGVAAWAVLPPSGRSAISLLPVVNGLPALTASNGLGLVCPVAIPGQRRCREPYAEDLVVQDLPLMLRFANTALDLSGLLSSATAKVHTPYPSIMRDSYDELCGGEWTAYPSPLSPSDPSAGARSPLVSSREGLERQLEPWLAYFTRIPVVSSRGWSFGIANHYDFTACAEGTPDRIQYKESCVVETRVWRPLNETVGREMSNAGWSIVNIEAFGRRNGLCAHGLRRLTLSEYNSEFGWPRWTVNGWAPDFPEPADWDAYQARERWFRTANDSALTQMVNGHGGDGRQEAVSGTIHPTAQGHARLADLIIEALSR